MEFVSGIYDNETIFIGNRFILQVLGACYLSQYHPVPIDDLSGKTIQWPKEESRQYNDQNKNADNTMTKRTRTKRQTIVEKILYWKLNIEQEESYYKRGELKGWAELVTQVPLSCYLC
jgi:hypothetical protein